MALVDELIQSVGRSAGMSPQQARGVVGEVLRFLAARLPSPLFGELQAWLGGGQGPFLGPSLGPSGPPPSPSPRAAAEPPEDRSGR